MIHTVKGFSIVEKIEVFVNKTFQPCNSLSNEISGLIFFEIDWLDLLVQATLKSLVFFWNVEVFLEFPCFDPVNVGNLISGSSSLSEANLNIWKFSVHVMLKPSLEDFERNLTSMGDKCNRPVVWTFFTTSFLDIGMKIDIF